LLLRCISSLAEIVAWCVRLCGGRSRAKTCVFGRRGEVGGRGVAGGGAGGGVGWEDGCDTAWAGGEIGDGGDGAVVAEVVGWLVDGLGLGVVEGERSG